MTAGTHSITATYAGDASFNGSTSSAVTQTVNAPPTVACSVTPNSLWPPNHKLVPVTATVTVTSAFSGATTFTLKVTSNEPDAGLGGGDVPNDIQGFAAGGSSTSGKPAAVTGSLRAERADTGQGRVYTLTFMGTDSAKNSATCVTTVKVPHDQGK